MFDKCVASEIITGLKPELGISSRQGNLGAQELSYWTDPQLNTLIDLNTKGKSSIIFRS